MMMVLLLLLMMMILILTDDDETFIFPGQTTTLSTTGWTLMGKLRTQSSEGGEGNDIGAMSQDDPINEIVITIVKTVVRGREITLSDQEPRRETRRQKRGDT